MEYGANHFTPPEIITQLTELDALGAQWPGYNKQKMLNHYCRWRDKHTNSLFKKWFCKNNRKI